MKIFNHHPMNFSIDKWQYIFCYNVPYILSLDAVFLKMINRIAYEEVF